MTGFADLLSSLQKTGGKRKAKKTVVKKAPVKKTSTKKTKKTSTKKTKKTSYKLGIFGFGGDYSDA
jgi:hypothetical protein